LKEALVTQILLWFLLGYYVVFIDGVSLKSEGNTWGGSLVRRYRTKDFPFALFPGSIGI
jgi:hypothetical protein